jgi:hypothetical protein
MFKIIRILKKKAQGVFFFKLCLYICRVKCPFLGMKNTWNQVLQVIPNDFSSLADSGIIIKNKES